MESYDELVADLAFPLALEGTVLVAPASYDDPVVVQAGGEEYTIDGWPYDTFPDGGDEVGILIPSTGSPWISGWRRNA